MNNKKLIGNIGLSYASKNVVLGTDNIVEMMKRNKVNLILLSSTASFNTQKLVQNKAKTYNTDILMIVEEKNQILSKAVGKEKIVVLGITDKNFKKLILKNS